MAVLFYDTSAFVKYFTFEQGSEKIISLIDEPVIKTTTLFVLAPVILALF